MPATWPMLYHRLQIFVPIKGTLKKVAGGWYLHPQLLDLFTRSQAFLIEN